MRLSKTEFEQMEVEYFIPPGDDICQDYHQQWMDDSKDFLISIGLREDLMDWQVYVGDKLADYARACTDVRFRTRPLEHQDRLLREIGQGT